MTENYIEKPFLYKIKKVLRYIRLYGVSRTLAKIRGQLHMADDGSVPPLGVWHNPKCRGSEAASRHVAIIGSGNFAFTAIAYYCAKQNPQFLRSVFDVDKRRALLLCQAYRGAKVVDSVEDIIADPAVDLIFIASNHSSHATYAQKLIAAGKNVHIEKPHVVSWAQLRNLSEAMKANPKSKVYLGFNRPLSRLFHFVDRYLLTQSGNLMINWFIAGHDIPDDHWYFSEQEGGRILGNLCHWTDYTLRLVGFSKAFPVEIIPGSSPDSKSNFAINYRFGDGSLGVITFSAKGHSFEGVREWLSVHKGDAIVRIQDFHVAQVEIREKRFRKRLLFRDHGHRANVLNSLTLGPSVSREEMVATATVFLASRDAVESGRPVRITGDLDEKGKANEAGRLGLCVGREDPV